MKLAFISVFTLLCVVAVAAPKQRGSDRFIGTWDVELMPEDGGKTVKAVITFKEGNVFEVSGNGLSGLKPAQYEVDTRGIQTNAFSATVQGQGSEKMEWTGVTGVGQQIKGDVKWTKSNGGVTSYTYSGDKRQQ